METVLDYRQFATSGVVVSPQNASVCHFGVFELDLRAGELRKNGVKLRLQEQPYQVLLKLIEHHGEIVSREELRSTLWHEDTFVDFETGLNTAIKRLRETLGDSADNPTFIETVPRRGYKFIATVERPKGEESGIPGPSTPQGSSAKSFLRRSAFIAGVVVIVLICVAFWRSQPQPPTVTDIVRITNDGKAKNPINPPVTDGVHLYFIEGMPDTTGSGIAQVSAAGGETTWIRTTLQDVWAVSPVSPDRSELLVSKGVRDGSDSVIQLWVQPLPAGAPHPVGNIRAILATWTPDGTHIVYADGGNMGAIMMANKDGSEPHQLAKVSGLVRCIRYSPDGQQIRFDLNDPKIDSTSIWEMNANGKGIHPLLPDWKESSFQRCGNWSPDGNYYYFLAGRGNAQAIWVMPERRSLFRRRAKGPSRLTSGPIRFNAPILSSDGKRLFVLGEDPRVELMRYDLQARRFDSYLPGLSAGPVDFSRDRKWIAYVSYPDMTLWRSRVDGSDKMQLTFPPMRAYEPRWSPDGSQIVFMDVRFDNPWKIYLLSSSGGSPEALLQANPDTGSSNSNYDWEADPTWTPDGKSIIFGKTNEIGNGAIYRLDLKTRNASSIPGTDGLFSPRISPDGRYISALNIGQTKLMLLDASTNRWSSLVEGEQVGYNEWSHNGEYIYMRENRGGAGELVRVRIKDRVLEHLLSLKGFPQLSDGFASWIGLTPDDAPLLMRDRSVQEIYALDLRFP
ncbi:MAG TPA: winged helix-turn-helix domain-containing protein [Candidatus Acidoferrum sp.]|nr:winged helix-turn-helix domain-containing protein [Candidatus Acidoferrum sp.]